MRNRKAASAVGFALTATLVLAGCSSGSDAAESSEPPAASSAAPAESSAAPAASSAAPGESSAAPAGTFDITELCGDEEIQVALTDGAAGHTWRKIVLAEFKAEAAKCPNITDVFYADAGNDPQKAAADISGFVAQGVDVIVTLADHGDAMIPALREAFDAGVTIVPYYNALGGTVGVDYTDAVITDTYTYGKDMAKWVGENVESGNVIVVGGIASCSSCTQMYEGVKEELANYPNLTLVGDTFVATDYNPEQAERAVSGLINQNGDIAAMIGDYGVIAEAAMKAFPAAGKPYPALAISSGQNSVYCTWWDAKDAGNEYAFAAYEKATQVVRAALRRALADRLGVDWPESKAIAFERVIDTPAGILPPACDDTLPPDADMFSGLTDEELRAAVQ